MSTDGDILVWENVFLILGKSNSGALFVIRLGLFESEGFRTTGSKIEYMECKFNSSQSIDRV